MNYPTLCTACRHIMVDLRTFDGTSSADAPTFGGSSESSYRGSFDLLGIAVAGFFGLFGTIIDESKIALKKHRVRKLRAAIVPEYPFSLVCPLYLEIVRRA